MSEKPPGTKRTRRDRQESPPDLKNGKRQKPADDEDGQPSVAEWTTQQMTEDYVGLASRMMMYPLTKNLGSFGYTVVPQQRDNPCPLEHVSSLAFLKSPVREPSVFEKWAPYDVALFEAAIAVHGKEFFLVQKEIPVKTTKDVIEFYYVWKKTSRYAKWKKEYVPPGDHDPMEVTDDEKPASISGA